MRPRPGLASHWSSVTRHPRSRVLGCTREASGARINGARVHVSILTLTNNCCIAIVINIAKL